MERNRSFYGTGLIDCTGRVNSALVPRSFYFKALWTSRIWKFLLETNLFLLSQRLVNIVLQCQKTDLFSFCRHHKRHLFNCYRQNSDFIRDWKNFYCILHMVHTWKTTNTLTLCTISGQSSHLFSVRLHQYFPLLTLLQVIAPAVSCKIKNLW